MNMLVYYVTVHVMVIALHGVQHCIMQHGPWHSRFDMLRNTLAPIVACSSCQFKPMNICSM